MSVQATAWVLERSGLPLVDRAVLGVYAYHADEHGRNTWPSLETVARESGASRSTVCEAKKRLEASGHLIGTGTRPGGGRVYRLNMGDTAQVVREPDPPAAQVVREPDSGSPGAGPEQSLTVQEKETLFESKESDPIIARFEEAARERKIDVNPRLIRQALEDYRDLPDLEQHARDCANWLAEHAPRNGNAKPRQASATLRTWLRKEQAQLPTRGELPSGSNSRILNRPA